MNERSHFEQINDQIDEYEISNHCKRDLKGLALPFIMDIIDKKHEGFEELHKFELKFENGTFFRAKINGIHILYCFSNKKITFLRAFKNFIEYKKVLNHPEKLLKLT